MSWDNFGDTHDDYDLESLHDDDDDITEFFDGSVAPEGSIAADPEDEGESEPTREIISPTINRGLRSRESMDESDDAPSKWDKFKV